MPLSIRPHKRNVRGDRDALSTYFGSYSVPTAGDYVELDGSNQASWIPNPAGDATQDITGHFNLAGENYVYKIGDVAALQYNDTYNSLFVGLGYTYTLHPDSSDVVAIGAEVLSGAYATLDIDGSTLIGKRVGYNATSASDFTLATLIGSEAAYASAHTMLGATGIGTNVFSIISGDVDYSVASGYYSAGESSGLRGFYGGYFSAYGLAGDETIALGPWAGYHFTGDNSVLLGKYAGAGWTKDNILHIGYGNWEPLIYGEFDNNIVRLYGDTTILDPATLGSETLTETTFSTHANWNVTGDFTDDTGIAKYTHSAGSGTLTQQSASFAIPAVGGAWYKFTYTMNEANSYEFTFIATITTAFAETATKLKCWEDGTFSVYVKAKAVPGDFVISVTSTNSGRIEFDNVSLKRVTGGDLLINGTTVFNGNTTFSDAVNIVFNTTTGTKIGTATTQKLGFYNATPIVQPTEITDELTSISHTAPGTPDYAIQDLTDSTPFGFVTKDEGNTVLSVIANLQARVNELEGALSSLGLLADAD